MKHFTESAAFTLQETERVWTVDEIPVLTAALSIPQWPKGAGGRTILRLNRYYRQHARSFLAYCNRFLYPQAEADFRQACRTGAPLPCGRALLNCTVTCTHDRFLSLYLDCTEWAGTARAVTLRRSDTWDLATGWPVSARDCFPRGVPIRRRCLSTAREVCARQAAEGLCVYADNLSMRLRRHLNLRNFYLSEEGFHFYYQMYAIAPAIEGIPTFLLPFSEEDGPHWPVTDPGQRPRRKKRA